MRYLTLLPALLLALLFSCDPEDITIPDPETTPQPVALTELPPEYHHGTIITPRQMEVTLPLLGLTQQMTVEEVNGQLFIEGDILLGDVSEFPNRAATIVVPSEQWPGGVIPYHIPANHPAKATIEAAIQEVIDQTNLCLTPRHNHENYVHFIAQQGCSSHIGMTGGRQNIDITTSCGKGSVIHEILHAAGVYHEQCRSDRDDYITVHFENIIAGYENNFIKYQAGTINNHGTYDYGSIMHYPEKAFTKNGGATIRIKTPPAAPGTIIGQRLSLSQGDIAGINDLYPNASFCGESEGYLISYGGSTNWQFVHNTQVDSKGLLVGDFNGDGSDDLLWTTGSNWQVSYSATAPWFTVNGSDYRSDKLLIGYFDTDNKADVLLADGDSWRISSGANTNWVTVNGSDFQKADLLVGNFYGDTRDDIMVANGNNWRVSDAARTNWITINGSDYHRRDLIVGNFAGDAYDDILLADGDNWEISDNANTNWRTINGSDYAIGYLMVGKFNGDNTDDIFMADGDSWRVSDNADTNWRTINGSDFTKQDLVLGDFNGDGLTDVLRWYGN
ncbi:M12 family metallopeptidase [Neolewinella persica]|uniref:M12 family metallopeptidase n=1 Tax=Neolewinella persica TaxID=70998 RepID=UPI0003A7FC30|nr:M12 family metallopeptidase [Neolewinella persica]